VISNLNSKLDKAMTPEQFTQVVEAILDGKYSWACVLILQYAGYNPLHYIPYRTYNRLMKENCSSGKKQRAGCNSNLPQIKDSASPESVSKIRDLNYLEPIHEQPSEVRGGDRPLDFVCLGSVFDSINISLLQ
jgi:hypothetical protein